METTPTDVPEHHHLSVNDAGKLGARMSVAVIMCLLIVMIIMAFALVYVTVVAGNAQNIADSQQAANEDLRNELACRAKGATDFDLAAGRLQASIGEALLLLGKPNNEDAMKVALADIDADVKALNTAADTREKTLTDCTSEATG